MKKKYIRALAIAGSDSGGGAGIQADLKTFAALGCYGMSVITALTAQNTTGVKSIFEVSPQFIKDQIDAVFSDIGVDAVKIGMLHSPHVIEVVAGALKQYKPSFVVLDPVMVAKGGDRLLKEEAVLALKNILIPLCHLITPNLPELYELTEISPDSENQIAEACIKLQEFGARWVLAKGGHGKEEKVRDLLFTPDQKTIWIDSVRVNTPNTHGTGCTFSSAITAFIAKGERVEEAFKNAKTYLTAAIQRGAEYELGSGHGPVFHAI